MTIDRATRFERLVAAIRDGWVSRRVPERVDRLEAEDVSDRPR